MAQDALRPVGNRRSEALWRLLGRENDPIASIRMDDLTQHVIAVACIAIITNTPHNTKEAYAIVRNLIADIEKQDIEFVAALFRSMWDA